MKRFNIHLPADLVAGVRALGLPWSEAVRVVLRAGLEALEARKALGVPRGD